MNTKTVDDSPVARGVRLKKARRLAGLSAEELAGKIGYSRQTISYWENATYSGLSHKGARKIISVLKESGVNWDINWLLYGVETVNGWPETGSQNQQNWQIAENAKLLSQLAQPLLLQEIALFKQLHKNAAVLQLDDAIQPLCKPNDWVGGCFETIHADLFGKICLVELEGQLQIKQLKAGSNTKTLYLHSPYDSRQTQEPPLEVKRIALDKAAKIIRVWRS